MVDQAERDRRRPRALRRAEDGRTLQRDEVASLLTATGDDLERLVAQAGAVRDRAPWYADGAWGRDDTGTQDLQPQGVHPADPPLP